MNPLWWLTAILIGTGTASIITFKKFYMPTETPQQRVYRVAEQFIGQHIYNRLNASIPAVDGCAASVSYVLQQAEYKNPCIPTVNGLIDWMVQEGFIEVTQPEPGDIITAHSPNHAVTTYAHTGVVMKYGICSNTSFPIAGFDSGEWAENYPSVVGWERAFSTGGSQTRFFRPV